MSDEVSRLNRLDTCAVSDAMDKVGLRGVVTGIHQYSTQRRIAGRVVTVKLGIDDGRPAASRHLGTTAIETGQSGDVIVVEHDAIRAGTPISSVMGADYEAMLKR
jgi:4-hydroxy-4-methyl-2-oxoglutarate aldolase